MTIGVTFLRRTPWRTPRAATAAQTRIQIRITTRRGEERKRQEPSCACACMIGLVFATLVAARSPKPASAKGHETEREAHSKPTSSACVGEQGLPTCRRRLHERRARLGGRGITEQQRQICYRGCRIGWCAMAANGSGPHSEALCKALEMVVTVGSWSHAQYVELLEPFSRTRGFARRGGRAVFDL